MTVAVFTTCNRTEKAQVMHMHPPSWRVSRLGKETHMYAIIETGGKQIKVEDGSVIWVEKLDAQEGENVTFDKVLYVDGKVGKPFVEGASVTGVVEKQGKGKKITIVKYRPKKSSTRRKQGHRQPYTRVKIESINA